MRAFEGVLSLIGMPGSGKSTIGRKLAHQLGVAFADSDAAVERRLGCSIARYFENAGEPAFREIEAEVLASLIGISPAVVATGGGSVLRPASRELLRTKTHCVYLKVPFQTLRRRLLRDTKRPLLQGPDPEQRLSELARDREPVYVETASVVVDTAGLSSSLILQAVLSSLPAASTASKSELR